MQISTVGASQGASAGLVSPKLVQAAHEFEGQMMQELLKPLNDSQSTLFSDDDSQSNSSGALGDFASESLAKALSNNGGFGIANQVIRQLSGKGAQG